MRSALQNTIASILAGTALTLVSSGAYAAGAVTPKAASAWVGGNNVFDGSNQIQTTSASLNSKNSWTDNTSLANSSWGHTGVFWTFEVTAPNQNVNIDARVLTGNYNIAFTVWASGASAFNGGTAANGSTPGLYEPSNIIGSNPAHDFNQVGQVGSFGTLWATDPSVAAHGGGNLLDTLAYANSGVAHTDSSQNDYGQIINYGVNQVASDNTYFSGAVAGAVGSNFADIRFNNLATGWYTIFVGGANSAQTLASTYQITVSSVPVPGAVYLFGTAMAGLLAAGRRKQNLV
jgi:hypothetical protein